MLSQHWCSPPERQLHLPAVLPLHHLPVARYWRMDRKGSHQQGWWWIWYLNCMDRLLLWSQRATCQGRELVRASSRWYQAGACRLSESGHFGHFCISGLEFLFTDVVHTRMIEVVSGHPLFPLSFLTFIQFTGWRLFLATPSLLITNHMRHLHLFHDLPFASPLLRHDFRLAVLSTSLYTSQLVLPYSSSS